MPDCSDSTKGNFEWITYEPKKWDDKTDVELKIQYAGICASVGALPWLMRSYCRCFVD